MENYYEIKRDYILHGYSLRRLSKLYGPHFTTISYHAKKEGWVKGGIMKEIQDKTKDIVTKTMAEINAEYDRYYDELVQKAVELAKEGEMNAVDTNLTISTLKIARDERRDIRGELTPHQQAKLDLDREKFAHKKEMDEKNYNLRKDKKNKGSGGGEEGEGYEFID